MGKVFVHDQTSKNTAEKRANAKLTVNCPSGSVVNAINGETVYTELSNTSGKAVFTGLHQGIWSITIQHEGSATTTSVEIVTDHEITMKFFEATINITYPAGSTCTCTDGNVTYNAPDTSGTWSCKVPYAATWTIYCSNGSQSKDTSTTITADGQIKNVKVAYFNATITVTYPKGAICSCSDGGYIYSASDTSGTWTFSLPSTGAWTVTATDGVQTVSKTVNITSDGQANTITIKFFESTITITYPAGATCTCTDGTSTFKAPNTSGKWTVVVPRIGTWIIKAVDGSNSDTKYVDITKDGQTASVTCAFFISYINVTYPSGSFKVVLWAVDSYGKKTESSVDTSGSGTTRFIVRQAGTYEVGAYRVAPYVGIETSAGDYNSKTTTISASGKSVSITLSFNTIPTFTYSGKHKIVNDSGNTITTSTGNWNIIFTTGGLFKATALNGAKDGIDVFVVGGGGNGGASLATEVGGYMYSAGGGGGGGGYRQNSFNVKINENSNYEITIASRGGTSSAFGVSASGGSNGGKGQDVGDAYGGGEGGTGGSEGGRGSVNNANSGENGEDGAYPFVGTTGKRYGPGGAGGSSYNGGYNDGAGESSKTYTGGKDGGGNSHSNATANSGGGGGGGTYTKDGAVDAGNGASGIVIIRNKR